MANPTKFSRTAANPAVQSVSFPKNAEGWKAAAEFAAQKEAEGFRTQTTSRFGGRDMATKQSFKVTVVHVFERDASAAKQRAAEAHAAWEAREAGKSAQ